MYKATAKVKAVWDQIVIPQNRLDLVDEEMENLEGLKEYIQMYHTPEGFEVTEVSIEKV